ncbi:PadR family transcriptional regulator [Salinigranum salinum]|uniref:PadR family transcriptional regulator n=1 Tax=Salinigranum salinum TaxID=1364937 RepID=UPI0012608FDC|nr:PadR family transcriptional regulator [Salinigranum salinum]
MFNLTGFQRDLLYAISSQTKPSGQEIKEILERDVEEVRHGRLYPNLDTLVEHDYVEKGQLDRRTNYYEITEEGRQLLHERREWENERVEFLS